MFVRERLAVASLVFISLVGVCRVPLMGRSFKQTNKQTNKQTKIYESYNVLLMTLFLSTVHKTDYDSGPFGKHKIDCTHVRPWR